MADRSLTKFQMAHAELVDLISNAFDIRPSDARSIAEKVVEEQQDIPTFVIRGTQGTPRITMEGSIVNAHIELVQESPTAIYADGLKYLEYFDHPTFKVTFKGPFSIRDEREKNA